ncbi:MAG TPA: prolyl oligopeptidase family serine peptidase [Chitinophagaceae bacterium]|nr:prolyl oligopeptidase family serine peptidase [Chitinophagaceae bacterium]
MKYLLFGWLAAGFPLLAICQKKPLDHSVYDSWQSIGQRAISHDGKWFVYSIDVQEGDPDLVIEASNGSYRKSLPRGSEFVITADSRYLICRIRPTYLQMREAKIRKSKGADMPGDSLAIMQLGKDSVFKIKQLKSFQVPGKQGDWVAFLTSPASENKKGASARDSVLLKARTDSLLRVIDSLERLVHRTNRKPGAKGDIADWENSAGNTGQTPATGDLHVHNLVTGKERIFPRVLHYLVSKNGSRVLLESEPPSADSSALRYILLFNPSLDWVDTLSRGGNEYDNFSFSDDGLKLAYTAERDASPGDLQRFYRIWYYQSGMDSARLLIDKNSVGMTLGMTVSPYGPVEFSQSGKRLLFGVAPIEPPRDTTLPELDKVHLDIWNYQDDYLQPEQLKRLGQDTQRSYLSVYDLHTNTLHQLGSEQIPQVLETREGDGNMFVGITDFGKRIERQWTGTTRKDIYAMNPGTGETRLVTKDLLGPVYPSPSGKFILWYDNRKRQYFCWDGKVARCISDGVRVPLYDEQNDMPDDPRPYGLAGWKQGDSAVLVYDRYGIWVLDPLDQFRPYLLVDGRKSRQVFRYIKTDPEEKYIRPGQTLVLQLFNEVDKSSGLASCQADSGRAGLKILFAEPVYLGAVQRARDYPVFLVSKESFSRPPDLYTNMPLNGRYTDSEAVGMTARCSRRITSLNPQQAGYLWGTAELFSWKAYDGKTATGILYKPENFDARRTYPMICYFYERLSDGLNQYIPPAPTPSRLNISFFVSRGYLVFAPDIHYGTGHPGKDAFNYVVSGARALVRKGFVDSTRIGIQGQSWGGYQVAYLITATHLFRAAWAGAPVANMTSAYGGIRWSTGLNRQFQYEKTQSRIGASLWDKPQLYIDNSPLFHLQAVTTPLVIMSNDNDGAVPWYQGIELFTAMRRLGKKVWLLDYNGEDHNLVERKNRKDIQIREQQYFDWLLKGAQPPVWITQGIPAVRKGKTWGFELEE